MVTRRRVLSLSLSTLAVVGVAGCSSKVQKPQDVQVENPSDAYDVQDVSSWTAGSGFEHGATLIVDGTLQFTADTAQMPPKIQGEFTRADGHSETITAKYANEKTWVAYDERKDHEFDPGSSVGFRLFYRPEEQTDVRTATVRVQGHLRE